MTEVISNDILFRAIVHGASLTREKRDDLNRINVFPVVDNDTGTNLAHTMQAILRNAEPSDNVRATLQTIARSALIGARGNSGAIFSQYFNGLYQSSPEKDHVTLPELAANFQEAFNRAFHALEKPVEGTVITLMRAWAVSFREHLDDRKSMRELFESSLERIRKSLEETSETLEVLKKLHVVDAGALGFYYFMEGFVQVILGKVSHVHIDYAAITPMIAEDIHRFGETADIPFRYCTEVLLESDSLNEDDLRQELNPLGDCLLISAGDNLYRVHLHTNQPWEVIRLAARRGKILESKADDMVQQNELASDLQKGIALVTDSVADLPREFVHLHGISQFPINIMIDGVSYADKITVDGEYLNARLDQASTAQPNIEQILTLLRPILKQYDKVLILTVSAHMSGTYSRFAEALTELDSADAARIALIDTRVNSGAEGLIVREAARLIGLGTSFDEIVCTLESLRARAKILVSVRDIEPMARSGRVSEKIGDLLIRLKFKPLVSIDPAGKGTIKGVAFSDAKNWKLLLRSLRGKSIDDYVIVHAGDPQRAEQLRQETVRLFKREPAFITEISAAVTLFAGKGSVAVAYLEKAPLN